MIVVNRIVLSMGGIVVSFLLTLCEPVHAEWYVAGYGGVSTNGEISDVDLPSLALTTVNANPDFQNPSCTSITAGCIVNQNMSATDIELDDSVMFGAKIGRFFNDMGFPWLGLELEAFTTKPDISAQTLSTHLEVERFIQFAPQNDSQLNTFLFDGQLQVQKSSLRVTTLALNLLARYPGEILQPYVGVGLGGFWFKGKGQFEGSRIVPGLNALGGLRIQILDNWVIFGEAKFNRATVDGLGPTLGMKGNYEIVHFLGGIAFVFGTN